jgi:hypothetical protein
MIIRTTNQIKDHFPYRAGKPEIGEEWDKKEWVCLSDLKKDIKEWIDEVEQCAGNGEDFVYIKCLNNVYDWLCNSSEQNSVSGEHNTGEGVSQGIFQPLSSSSPVQNPNDYLIQGGLILLHVQHLDELYRNKRPNHICKKNWYKNEKGEWFCDHLIAMRKRNKELKEMQKRHKELSPYNPKSDK